MINSDKRRQDISRRNLLGLALGTSLLGLVGQASSALFRFFKPRIQPGSFGTLISAGQIGEFQPGTVSHVQQGRFYISRLEDGGFLALWQRCTHLGCTIPWREDEGLFHCPCHSSIFNTVGEVISGPAPRPMDLFPVSIQDGEVLVDTGEPFQRSRYEQTQAAYE